MILVVPKKEEINIISSTMQQSTGLFIIFHKVKNEPRIHGRLHTIYARYPYHNEAAGFGPIAFSMEIHLSTGLA